MDSSHIPLDGIKIPLHRTFLTKPMQEDMMIIEYLGNQTKVRIGDHHKRLTIRHLIHDI
jgi:hypothetical protein